MKKVITLLNRLGLTLQIAKTAFAAAFSWVVATSLLHSQYPYFAAVAAIITVQVTVADSVDKASQRIIGIIGGVLLSMLLGHWFQVGALSIFFILLLGMGIAKAFRMNQQIISQVAISSLLVMAFGQDKQGYAYERIIETMLGSVIAVLINALIVPQNAVPDVKRELGTFGELSASTLASLTALLEPEAGQTGRQEVDALIQQAENCRKARDLARQSLKYNPLLTHKRTQLKQLEAGMRQLEKITIQIRGIRRSLVDLQTNPAFQLESAAREQVRQALEATAGCISAYGLSIVSSRQEADPRLEEAIARALAAQDHCLRYLHQLRDLASLRNLGSILTDLDRIVAEVQSQVVEKPAAAEKEKA
ncbi:MAG: FUSC family protein [Adhaeribacter sp.]